MPTLMWQLEQDIAPTPSSSVNGSSSLEQNTAAAFKVIVDKFLYFFWALPLFHVIGSTF